MNYSTESVTAVQIRRLYPTGFDVAKQNRFAKISERSEEKSLSQTKSFLDLQIIL